MDQIEILCYFVDHTLNNFFLVFSYPSFEQIYWFQVGNLKFLKLFDFNHIQVRMRVHWATLWMITQSIVFILAVLWNAQELNWLIMIKAVPELTFSNFLIGTIVFFVRV